MPCPNDHRLRLKTVGFRCTEAQNDLVTMLASAAGMTKQDYIMSKLTDTTVVVKPDVRTYRTLKKEMAAVYVELSRLKDAGEMDEDLLKRVMVLSDLFIDMSAQLPRPILEIENDLISSMGRE